MVWFPFSFRSKKNNKTRRPGSVLATQQNAVSRRKPRSSFNFNLPTHVNRTRVPGSILDLPYSKTTRRAPRPGSAAELVEVMKNINAGKDSNEVINKYANKQGSRRRRLNNNAKAASNRISQNKVNDTYAKQLFEMYNNVMDAVIKELAQNPAYSVEQLCSSEFLESSLVMEDFKDLLSHHFDSAGKELVITTLKEQVAKLKRHSSQIMAKAQDMYVKSFEDARERASKHALSPESRELYILFMSKVKSIGINDYNSRVKSSLKNFKGPKLTNYKRPNLKRKVNLTARLNRGNLENPRLISAARSAAHAGVTAGRAPKNKLD
jgi:hypothetical protein